MSHPITGFWFSPTYGCNNRCQWCYAGAKQHIPAVAEFKQAKKYLSIMAAGGAKSCILVGGEPTTYADLIPLITHGTKIGLTMKLMSNGRRLSDRGFVTELKRAGLAYCLISIEGLETVHEQVTRIKGSFAESTAGIANCLTKGLAVNSISTVSSFNKHQIDDLIKMLRNLGLKRTVFNMCSSQPSGYETADCGLIDLNEYARIVEDIGLRHDGVRFYALLPLCLFDQEKLVELLRLGRLRVSCSLFTHAVAIDPDGAILPCTHMPDLCYGNLDDDDIMSKLPARKAKEIAYLRSHAPCEKCIDCRLWNTCLGGCNLIWFSRIAADHIKGLG